VAPLELAGDGAPAGEPVYSAVTMLARHFNSVDTEIKIRAAMPGAEKEITTMGRWGTKARRSPAFYLSCPSMSGYSGSPVLTADGKVVGVLFAGGSRTGYLPFAERSVLTDVTSASHAVPLAAVKAFIAGTGAQLPPAGTATARR